MIIFKKYDESYLESLTYLFNLWDDMVDLSSEQISETIDLSRKYSKNETYMAIDENGAAVGYIYCGIGSYVGVLPFLEIIQIMIVPELRGSGIGKQMMDFVTDLYYAEGIRQIRLHSRTKLKNAHEFYKRLGFKEFKESKFFLKDL